MIPSIKFISDIKTGPNITKFIKERDINKKDIKNIKISKKKKVNYEQYYQKNVECSFNENDFYCYVDDNSKICIVEGHSKKKFFKNVDFNTSGIIFSKFGNKKALVNFPLDSLGDIISFISSSKTFFNVYILSKDVKNYIDKENPECARYVYFVISKDEIRRFDEKSYVIRITFQFPPIRGIDYFQSYNDMRWIIEKFPRLEKLHTINAHIPFQLFKENIQKLIKLSDITIENCTLPLNFYEFMSNVKKLTLLNCRVYEINFSKMEKLQYFKLRTPLIKVDDRLPPRPDHINTTNFIVEKKHENLEVLDCKYGVEISNISLGYLSNLKVLLFQQEFDFNTIVKFNNLKELYLLGGDQFYYYEYDKFFNNLESIIVEECYITWDIFSRFKNLKRISIGQEVFDKDSEKVNFSIFNNLKSLQLDTNVITPKILSTLPQSLKELYLWAPIESIYGGFKYLPKNLELFYFTGVVVGTGLDGAGFGIDEMIYDEDEIFNNMPNSVRILFFDEIEKKRDLKKIKVFGTCELTESAVDSLRDVELIICWNYRGWTFENLKKRFPNLKNVIKVKSRLDLIHFFKDNFKIM